MNKGINLFGMMSVYSELESSLPKFVDSMNDLSQKKSFFQTAHVDGMYSYMEQDFLNMKSAVAGFMSSMRSMGISEVKY